MRLLRQPFAIAGFFLPFAGLFEYKWATLILIALVLSLPFVAPFPRWRPALSWLILFGLILLWCLASALWSIDPEHSLARFGRLAPTVAAGLAIGSAALLMDGERRETALRGLALGLLGASAIALLGHFYVSWANAERHVDAIVGLVRSWSFRPFSAVAAILLFIVAAGAVRRPRDRLMIAAAAAAAGAILISGSNASRLAMIVAVPVFLLALWRGATVARVLAAVLPFAFMFTAPAVESLDLPRILRECKSVTSSSAAHRLGILRFAHERIVEKPYLGWGLHTARLIPGRQGNLLEHPDYQDIASLMRTHPDVKAELIPLHPHNATLHVRLELGLPGLLLFAALYSVCCLLLLRRCPAGPPLAGGLAAITVGLVVGQLSFSVWQSWWLSAQFCSAAILLAALAGRRTGRMDNL